MGRAKVAGAVVAYVSEELDDKDNNVVYPAKVTRTYSEDEVRDAVSNGLVDLEVKTGEDKEDTLEVEKVRFDKSLSVGTWHWPER